MRPENLDRGAIYWVDIPPAHTVGSEQNKNRPFIVVSKTSLHKGDLFVGVPLSSKVAKACAYRILIPAVEIIKDAGYGRPVLNSVALTDQIRAVSMARLGQRIGRLSDSAIISVELGMSYLLDL